MVHMSYPYLHVRVLVHDCKGGSIMLSATDTLQELDSILIIIPGDVDKIPKFHET